MYRVIYESVSPRDRRKLVERGPWPVHLRALGNGNPFSIPNAVPENQVRIGGCAGHCHDQGTTQHLAYRSQLVVVEYPWHRHHGKQLKLFRRTGRAGGEVAPRQGASRSLSGTARIYQRLTIVSTTPPPRSMGMSIPGMVSGAWVGVDCSGAALTMALRTVPRSMSVDAGVGAAARLSVPLASFVRQRWKLACEIISSRQKAAMLCPLADCRAR